MNSDEVLKRINEQASSGNVNAKIAVAINKIKHEGKIIEGINELINLASYSDQAVHNLFKIVYKLKLEQYYDEVFAICKTLSEQQNEIGLIDMGVIYQVGMLNQKQDINKAINYYQQAIDLYQSGISCQSIGAMYYKGEVIEQDLEKAYNYFMRGADFHYADSEEALAQMYLYGKYVNQDIKMASYWYENAFNDGKRSISVYLGNMYMPFNNMLNDEKKAFEWYMKGSQYNISECYTMLGFLYENGEEVEQNPTMAVECYKKGAELGNGKCCYMAGLCYMEGSGVNMNYLQARRYLEKAIQLGVKEAYEYLKMLPNNPETANAYDSYTDTGVYINKTTATGLERIENERIMREQERRSKNREILRVAAAASNSTGFIDDNLGFFIDKDGNEVYADSDTGYIVDEQTGNLSFYDKELHTVYDTQSGKFAYLDINDSYIYNYNTGNMNYTSGNFTSGN